MKNLYSVLALSFISVACGSNEEISKAFKGTASDPSAEKTPATEKAISGAVVSAFPIVVNGESFPDIEQWFTSKQATIAKDVEAAGYEFTDAHFVGSLGITDFANDVTVFIGGDFASNAFAGTDGSFKFTLPATSKESDSYSLRAVKRIQVEIVNGSESVKTVCYIMSATATAKADKFANLSTYKTQLTSYSCEDKAALEIPNAEVEAKNTAARKAATTAKVEAVSQFAPGSEFNENNTEVCNYSPNSEYHKIYCKQ